MEPFGYSINCLSLTIASLLAIRGVKKRSLSVSGGIAGFFVGLFIVSTGLRGLLLFVFYQFGSWSTKYKNSTKQQYDNTVTISSCRGPIQVLAVSIIPTCYSMYHAIYYGPEQSISWPTSTSSSSLSSNQATMISCAILAHHATGLADTLASEMGILSSFHRPILITKPWKSVPPGTNGGITLSGLLWSMVGGFIISTFLLLFDYISGILVPQYCVIILLYGTITGLLGSIIDSLLGATIQITYYNTKTKQVFHSKQLKKSDDDDNKNIQHICGMDIVTNEQVNFISMAITSYIGGWRIAPWLLSFSSSS